MIIPALKILWVISQNFTVSNIRLSLQIVLFIYLNNSRTAIANVKNQMFSNFEVLVQD